MKYLPNQVFRKFNGAVEVLITRIEGEDIYLSRRESKDLSECLAFFAEPNDGAYKNCSMISDCTNSASLHILLSGHLMRQVKDAAIATEIVRTHLVLWEEHHTRAAKHLDAMNRMFNEVSMTWSSPMLYPVPEQIMFCCSCNHHWNPMVGGGGDRCPVCDSPDLGGFSEQTEPEPGEFSRRLALLRSDSVGEWSEEAETYLWRLKEGVRTN